MDTGDFCLHADEKTGKAYIWFERHHFQMICATLTDDYTAVTGEHSVYDNWIVPETREAPTFFERSGHKYLITSGTNGYFPNPSRACMFDDYHGKYKDLGLVCEGDKSGISFNAQFTSVIQVNGQYIACADRWMPQWWVPMMAKQIVSGTARHFKDYKPDLSPRKAETLQCEDDEVQIVIQDVSWAPEANIMTISFKATPKSPNVDELHSMWSLDTDGSYIGEGGSMTVTNDIEDRGMH